MSENDLRVADGLVIPGSELQWRFSPSGGPGGQHANRSATRAELVFDFEGSAALTDEQRRLARRRLGSRARSGTLIVTVDESRSQWRNRQLARARLADLLRDAVRPERRRRRTKPPASAARRRLEAKRRRSELKRLRRPPSAD